MSLGASVEVQIVWQTAEVACKEDDLRKIEKARTLADHTRELLGGTACVEQRVQGGSCRPLQHATIQPNVNAECNTRTHGFWHDPVAFF